MPSIADLTNEFHRDVDDIFPLDQSPIPSLGAMRSLDWTIQRIYLYCTQLYQDDAITACIHMTVRLKINSKFNLNKKRK